MDIDAYQHCPCQSGKKIKFCCGKSVFGDLNEIVHKNEAGQTLAALSQLERVIEKHGPLNCLLTIQTHILISQGDLEKAKASNDLFLKENPGHPIGLQHQALITLAEGETLRAADYLQDSMDAIKGTDIPISVANAFRLTGIGLLTEGHILAARAHFQFAQILKGKSDEELQKLMFETFRFPNQSILLKFDRRLAQPPQDKEWGSKYVNVIRAMDRGQFRKALSFLKRIDGEYPDEPVILHAIALLAGIRADMNLLSDAWRKYSRVEGLSKWDAVEAEAMAQLFTRKSLTDELDVVRMTFDLTDLDPVAEVILSSARFSAQEPMEADPFEEGPAPRANFYFLDRDKQESADDLTLENISSVVGEVLLYGKQTDRPARLEWIATRNALFAESLEHVKSLIVGWIDGNAKEAILGNTTAIIDVLTWNWHLPTGVTRQQHAQLVEQQRQVSLDEGWAELEFTVLDDKSPREIAGDEKYDIALSALVVHLEQSADSQASDRSAATSLRESLGIMAMPLIDPEEVGEKTLSPLQQQYLEFEKLDDDRLLNIHAEAMAIGNYSVLRKVVPEVLSRQQLDETIPRDISLSMMAQMTEDDDEALQYMQQAKQVAKSKGRPIGVYLVQEFELRIQRGLTDKLSGLLQRIQVHHLGEPNVEYQLARVLDRFGLLNRDAPRSGDEADDVEAESESEAGIWTPDQDSPAESESEEVPEQASKLWLPGSD